MSVQNAVMPPGATGKYKLGEPGESLFKRYNHSVMSTLIDSHQNGQGHLHSVDTEGLWEVYLDSIEDPIERQLHNCRCCQHFIRKYGGLVWLDEKGNSYPATWNHAYLDPGLPQRYRAATMALRREVERRTVTDLFLWSEPSWGVKESGGFSHFYTEPTKPKFEMTLSADQAMAVRREDHKHLGIAVKDPIFKPEHLDKALAMLQMGNLANPDALIPVAKFLRTVQDAVGRKSGEDRSRILWYHVARAARGWCTPRGGALGALLEDIAAGKSMQTIARNQDERMHPLKYQRAQVAPSVGNVQRAEKIVEKLGLAASLRRKPMALHEARLFWRPRDPKSPPPGGVFSHLQVKQGPPPMTGSISSQPVTMTFVKFERDVLPHVLSMKMKTPFSGNYCSFTTATDPTAPPILKWDHVGDRNPGALYVYHGGSTASNWHLPSGSFVEVLGLSHTPGAWTGSHEEVKHVLFILEGARDRRNNELALFPTCIKSELHEVRATIEAHSKSRKLDEELAPLAAGYLIGSERGCDVLVTTQQGTAYYRIDRYE